MNVLRMWMTAVVELVVIIWLVPTSVSVHLVLQEMVAHAQVIMMVLELLVLGNPHIIVCIISHS